MNLQQLKVLAVVAPILFLVALEGLQYYLLEPNLSRGQVHLVMISVMLGGITAFWWIVWRAIEDIERELKRAYDAERTQSRQLAALHEATLQVTSERDPVSVLRQVVELSARVVGARYGALTILGTGRSIEHFVTHGLADDTLVQLGPPPKGHGILGVVTRTRKPLRLDDVAAHPRFSGFPPHHPHMRTLLAVPIIYKETLMGNLYLSERLDDHPFTEQDQETLERFASQAAIAVANARLYEQAQRLSAVEERERIAMDLHDGVIQQIYGVGLSLENAADLVEAEPTQVKRDLDRAIDRLSEIVSDIRHYIMDLRSNLLADDAFPALLRKLIDTTTSAANVDVELSVEGEFGDVSRHLQWELWHIAREALANAVHHGEPHTIRVSLSREDGRVRLLVGDDGRGFVLADDHLAASISASGDDAGDASTRAHQGLSNMEKRAGALGGTLEIHSAPGQGTEVAVAVPVERDALALEN